MAQISSGTVRRMDKLTKLSGGTAANRQSTPALLLVLFALSCNSLLVTAQELELCPTTCACPVPTPISEGAEGMGEAATGANGNSIVVTRQKCDPNDVETCQANW